ncbi:efflux RND transporter periplasmic adaptor subunit [Sinomicrobium pectinilyticum]|uniref:Efflux RND transporter periplasmic adaptor subunit n=1 Tax=Sinomicrobium pectinilyticum TaxID=1084421 RepID=A0A3N0ECP8_SINP1|nr:efflux RND transporter periplasmic adaptor subunit [Sinomicrobium pectinilyticum]RNL85610.1 efflux RND transporter periplasmic adaptor subunit [Sinomicrobium pectinilyticum]
MKNYKYQTTVLPLLAFLLVTSVFVSCSDGNAAEQGPQALPAPYVHPAVHKITDWSEYIGRFEASERVEIRSRVNGYIQSVNFRDGDMVEKGQTLFIIDQRPYYVALKQAEAEKLQAEADLRRMQSDYDRIASVQDSRAVSAEEVEQRKQIAKSAEARLMAANARLAQARLDLSYTEIKAPISGKISEDFVNSGNYITGGASSATLLTTILAVNPIHFYFEGNENDFLKFHTSPGSDGNTSSIKKPVVVKLSGEGEYSREGYMDFVDNEIRRNTGTIRGRAVFENPDMQLESGMFGRLRLLEETKTDAILIPEAAISSNQSQKIVYTIGADSTVQVKPVRIGKLYGEKYRIVVGGLTEEDRIITGNLLKVRPGMKVAPKEGTFAVTTRDTVSVALR